MRRIAALAALTFAFGNACGGPRGDFGYLPQVTDLSVRPTRLAVGTPTTLNGQVTFWVPNGDLLFLFARVVDPSGQQQPLVRFDVSNAYGYTSGVLTFSLPVTATVPGTWQLEVFLKDVNGQDSKTATLLLPAS